MWVRFPPVAPFDKGLGLMTAFQDYCRKYPHTIIEGAIEKFKEFYPDLSPKDLKNEFNKQIAELLFNQQPSTERNDQNFKKLR